MAITKMTVVSVPVSNQATSRDFYRDVLGFAVLRDEQLPDGDIGERWVRVAPDPNGTMLSLLTWFDTMPPGSLQGIVLETNDVDQEYERLLGLGVKFDAPPRTEPWGRETILFDPDGNQLVLQQAPTS